ncbi:MAG: M48 family metalloprotease [Armatimonadota bacterium]|nr:M48 family metalloprotease [Armatimonadota bacterium]
MARRVRKRRKKKVPEAALTLDDYQFAGEKRVYWEGVGGLVGIWLFITWDIAYFLVGVLNAKVKPDAPLYHDYWLPIGLIVYLALAWLIANWLAVRPRRRQLKEAGMNRRVLNKTYPKLKSILGEQAKLLVMDEPEMYVIDDDTPYIFSMPGRNGTIVTTDPVVGAMSDEEMAALIAREMGHIKSHHVRMAFVTRFIRRANVVAQVLLFPVRMIALFLRGWLDLIEVTADRVALLVTGRPALVNAALVKLAVAADREAEISQEDLDAFLESATDISTDAAQIERHYMMGQFLTKQPHLRERIEEVTGFLRTEEGQQAMQKMTEMKQKLA